MDTMHSTGAGDSKGVKAPVNQRQHQAPAAGLPTGGTFFAPHGSPVQLRQGASPIRLRGSVLATGPSVVMFGYPGEFRRRTSDTSSPMRQIGKSARASYPPHPLPPLE